MTKKPARAMVTTVIMAMTSAIALVACGILAASATNSFVSAAVAQQAYDNNNSGGSSGSSNNNNDDNNNNTGSDMTARELLETRDLYLFVWNKTSFNATFHAFIEPFSAAGYGVYEERGSNVFAPGETIVLYVEPVGFEHKPLLGSNQDTLYLVNFTADYIITYHGINSNSDDNADNNSDDGGGTGQLQPPQRQQQQQQSQQSQELPAIRGVPVGAIISHRQNTEMFLELTLAPEEPFPEGDYTIRYVVRDEVSGRSFELSKDVRVSAPPSSSAVGLDTMTALLKSPGVA